MIVAGFPVLLTFILNKRASKENQPNVLKEHKFFAMLKNDWALFKRMYWYSDQTVDYIRFIIMLFIKITIPVFVAFFIYLFYVLVTDLILFDFNNITLDKKAFMLVLYVIKIVVTLLLLMGMLGFAEVKDIKTAVFKCAMGLFKWIIDGSMIYYLNTLGKQMMASKVNIDSFDNVLLLVYSLFLYLIVNYLILFFLANPFDIKTIFQTYHNSEYLKYISNIPKRIYTIEGKECNFREIVCYDKDKLEFNYKTNYIRRRKYLVTFTIVSKENPKRRVELSSIVCVKKRKTKKIEKGSF